MDIGYAWYAESDVWNTRATPGDPEHRPLRLNQAANWSNMGPTKLVDLLRNWWGKSGKRSIRGAPHVFFVGKLWLGHVPWGRNQVNQVYLLTCSYFSVLVPGVLRDVESTVRYDEDLENYCSIPKLWSSMSIHSSWILRIPNPRAAGNQLGFLILVNLEIRRRKQHKGDTNQISSTMVRVVTENLRGAADQLEYHIASHLASSTNKCWHITHITATLVGDCNPQRSWTLNKWWDGDPEVTGEQVRPPANLTWVWFTVNVNPRLRNRQITN